MCPLSLYQDLPHGLDVLVTIIWPVRCLISTRVGVIMWASCAKLIRESQEEHSFCLLALMSIILSLDWRGLSPTALNPFFLQWGCNKTCEPIRVFHVLRPNEVARYFPSAINEYSELACCWWQWTWADDQSSYRGRSWRRVCSSKLVTWSLVSQSQSWLQQSYGHFQCSRIGNRNGRFSVNFSDIESFFKKADS